MYRKYASTRIALIANYRYSALVAIAVLYELIDVVRSFTNVIND